MYDKDKPNEVFQYPLLAASPYPELEADIVIRGMTYTNRKGTSHTGDVVFSYVADEGIWKAPAYLYLGYYYEDAPEDLPAEFVLTRDEVEAMGVDANASRPPIEGLVYDGTKAPGRRSGTR